MKPRLATAVIVGLLTLSGAFVRSEMIFAEESTAIATSDATTELADGVYAFRHGFERSIFVVGDDGVIVTDPMNAAVAAAYRQEIAKITDKPIKYVVYSHSHWDRVSGAQLFKQEGAEIVAQQRCSEWFIANPNPNVVMPDKTFADKFDVSVGNRSLELRYFGPSHSECLVIMLAKPANMLYIPELITPPKAAFPVEPTVPHIKPYNIVQFFKSVDEFAAQNGVDRVVGSHVIMIKDDSGNEIEASPIGPVSLIAEQGNFWADVIRTVSKAHKDGYVRPDSFVQLDRVDLTPFEKYSGYNKDDLNVIFRRFVSFEVMGR